MTTASIKQQASTLTTGWDDKLEDASLNGMIVEMVAKTCETDVGGD